MSISQKFRCQPTNHKMNRKRKVTFSATFFCATWTPVRILGFSQWFLKIDHCSLWEFMYWDASFSEMYFCCSDHRVSVRGAADEVLGTGIESGTSRLRLIEKWWKGAAICPRKCRFMKWDWNSRLCLHTDAVPTPQNYFWAQKTWTFKFFSVSASPGHP